MPLPVGNVIFVCAFFWWNDIGETSDKIFLEYTAIRLESRHEAIWLPCTSTFFNKSVFVTNPRVEYTRMGSRHHCGVCGLAAIRQLHMVNGEYLSGTLL